MTNKFQTRKSTTEVTNSRTGKAEHEVKHTEKKHFIHPRLGAHADLFIEEDQESYYNIIIVLNYIPQP
jgi:hypothetical protein